MARILILADDLSGAADCGIVFRNAGLDTAVSLGTPADGFCEDVICIDADTRRMQPAAAAATVEQLAKVYAADPSVLLFKKIDSTLRGHLGPEIHALLRTRRSMGMKAFALFAPAFPANRRTTVSGVHCVDGRPVHHSEIWHNERMTGESYLPTMIESAGLTNAHLFIATIRSGTAALRQALFSASADKDVVSCDAEREEDLSAIAEAGLALEPGVVWIGSAGLARHLAVVTGLTGREDSQRLGASRAKGPILFVIGSISSNAKAQSSALAVSSGMRSIVVPSEVLLAGEHSPGWRVPAASLRDALENGQDILLTPGSESSVDLPQRQRLSLGLAMMSTPLCHQVAALVASGGETARAVLDHWKIRSIRLLGEVEPSVPFGIGERNGRDPVTIILKAGDFGTTETLVRCREALHS